MSSSTLKLALLGMAALCTTGAVEDTTIDLHAMSRAVSICLQATSKTGVADRLFIDGGWLREPVEGLPGDRYYSSGRLRASLGTRPGVGGSCIISTNIRSAYDLTALTRVLEKRFETQALTDSPVFALLPLSGKLVPLTVTPVPTGSVVSVAVEITH